jgi:hypothetical protein
MKRFSLVTILCVVAVVANARVTAASPVNLEFKGSVIAITTYQITLSPAYGVGVGTHVFGRDPFLAMLLSAGTSSDWFADDVTLPKSKLRFLGDGAIHVPSSPPYPNFIDLTSDGGSTTSFPTLYQLMQDFNPTLWNSGRFRVTGLQHFNYHANNSENKQVPEPATWMLMATSGLTWALFRKRRSYVDGAGGH